MVDSDIVVWIKVDLNPDSNIVVRLMIDYEYSKWFLQYLTLIYEKINGFVRAIEFRGLIFWTLFLNKNFVNYVAKTCINKSLAT